MGANTFMSAGHGENARAVFDRLVSDSQYESGHSYSGEIGMKRDFVKVGTVDTVEEAHALAHSLIDAGDRRIDDKWGPAGCIEVRKAPRPEAGTYFLFFGWASS